MNELAELTQEVRSLRLDVARLLGQRLTKTEMAERLGITLPTLRRRIETGSVPPPGDSGKWLLADVQAWEAGA